MRIAVTGGTGFIGRHLAAALTDEGHEVVLVARGADARDPSVRSRPRTRFVAASVTDEPRLTDACAVEVGRRRDRARLRAPPCDALPRDLAPQTRFTEQQIRKGLPDYTARASSSW